MTTPLPHSVTQLLTNWSDDERQAPNKLPPPVCGEVRRLADRHLRGRPCYNSRVLGIDAVGSGQ